MNDSGKIGECTLCACVRACVCMCVCVCVRFQCVGHLVVFRSVQSDFEPDCQRVHPVSVLDFAEIQ